VLDIAGKNAPTNSSEIAAGEFVFPRVWREDEEASCDSFPIWWTAKEVRRHLARREQARRSWSRAEEHRGFFDGCSDFDEVEGA